MREFASLAEEHRLILDVVTALEAFVARVERDEGFDKNDLEGFAQFFRDFADGIHHVKEEDVLLPAMTRHGFNWDGELLATIRHDHDQERYLVEVLNQTARQTEAWHAEDRRHVVSIGRSLAEFQRRHIADEAAGLYLAARSKLPGAVSERIDADLAAFQRRVAGEYGRLTEVGRALARRYAPESAGVAPSR